MSKIKGAAFAAPSYPHRVCFLPCLTPIPDPKKLWIIWARPQFQTPINFGDTPINFGYPALLGFCAAVFMQLL